VGWACGGPKAKRSIHVHPCIHLDCSIAYRCNGVERTGIYVAGLDTDDRRPLKEGNLLRIHPSLRIGFHNVDATSPQANESQCFEHGRVYFFSDNDIDWWCSEEAIHLNIPTLLQQECSSSGCQSREICHLCSSDEGASAIGWQTEERKQPPKYHIFEVCTDR
jgi:hypothetical protein